MQSDQRCYTTYYTENVRWHEIEAQAQAVSAGAEDKGGDGTGEGVIDISKLDEFGGHWDSEENHEFYGNVKMALDYDNELFLSVGGMLFSEIRIDIESNDDIAMSSKITNGSFCVLHGNGPGVILWRSFVKQIKVRSL